MGVNSLVTERTVATTADSIPLDQNAGIVPRTPIGDGLAIWRTRKKSKCATVIRFCFQHFLPGFLL